MMEETGKVVELKPGGTAMVLCQKGSACGHCAAADKCEMGRDSGERLVEARNEFGAAVGAQVKISISSQTFLKSSFLVYIVPLIALVVCAVIGSQVAQLLDNGLDPNVLSALCGIGGLVVSLLAIRSYNNKLDREPYLPRIVGVIDEENPVPGCETHGH